MDKIKVLIVDDSSIMRKLISKIVSEDPELEVVDTAMDGLFALKKMKKYCPDIILCDLEMPNMDGIDFLKMRNELGISIPVLVISSLGKSKPEIIFKTIAMGACDFIIKPSGSISMDIETLSEEIRNKIHYYYKKSILSPSQKKALEVEEIKQSDEFLKDVQTRIKIESPSIFDNFKIQKKPLSEKINSIKKISVISIGISTGGPNALRTILPNFPKDFPLPILIVQHMPPGFTREFANGLNDICQLKVLEAEDQMVITPGNIYISPGDSHLTIEKKSLNEFIVKLDNGPILNGHRPSVGMLFKSIEGTYNNESINIIMTGMGKDGAKEINELSQKGAIALAQSENTCVVFGMPKVAIEFGGIDEILPLEMIPNRVIDLIKQIGV